MIYVSTGGLRHQTAYQSAINFYNHGIFGAELSGGAYSSSYMEDIKSAPSNLRLQIHNYFPPPEIPFVFNLASSNDFIASQSMELVRSGIRLSLMVSNPVFSFHAGFRLNPKVSDLGVGLGKYNLVDRKLAIDIFGERMLILAEEARREGVKLLIENNVITSNNFNTFGEDPLLLTHPDEIKSFMTAMPSNVGLLMDVAHLKVSGRTLGFDLIRAHQDLVDWIKGYHLSDNDGESDSNQCISVKSWFWEVLLSNLEYYSLEVYGVDTSGLLDQHNLTLNQLNMLGYCKKEK